MRIAPPVLLLALLCVNAGGGIAEATPPAELPSAVATCESGRPSRAYTEPADACWQAFSDAVYVGQFAEAIAFARRGCEKYSRGDYCSFVERFEEASANAGFVRIATHRERLVRALAYAAEYLLPTDVEDAELGARARKHMNAPRRSRR